MKLSTHHEESGAATVTIRILTDQGSLESTLGTFRSLVGQLRAVSGCLSCHLLKDVHEPGELTFTAKWRSTQSLKSYVRSPAFRRLLAGIDLAIEEPRVTVRTPSGTYGFEFFERILEAQPERTDARDPRPPN